MSLTLRSDGLLPGGKMTGVVPVLSLGIPVGGSCTIQEGEIRRPFEDVYGRLVLLYLPDMGVVEPQDSAEEHLVHDLMAH